MESLTRLIYALSFIGIFFLSTPIFADRAIMVKELGKLVPYYLNAWDADSGDNFGNSVAISNGTVVIGSYQDNCATGEDCGSAHVYVQNTQTGLFEHKAKLTASHASAYHYFGYSVSLSGDTVIVGTYRYDPAGVQNGGRAYIFEKPLQGWSNMNETAILTATDIDSYSNFGISVDIDGEIAIVGNSHKGCTGGDSCGSAYLFQKPSSGWSDMNQSATLTASTSAAYDNFGGSVSISNNQAVVGASGVGCATGYYCGKAYVFNQLLSASGVVNENFILTASDATAMDFFSSSVDISGNSIIIGAGGDSCQDGDNCGAAYVFNVVSLNTGVNQERGKLTSSDAAAGDFFGNRVSINENLAVVGAAGHDCNTGNSCGAAYLYSKPTGGWKSIVKESSKIVASDTVASDQFGSSVAINSEYIVIGANTVTIGSKKSAGVAYIFRALASPGYLSSLYYIILY